MKNALVSFAVLFLVGCGAADLTETEVAQVDQAVSNVPNTCFGASGSNCSGPPGGFCTNSTTTAGWVSCLVTVGSQMHDTCCMQYPGGESCNGSPTAQFCTPPANSGYGTPYRCCKAEWDHAVGDMAAGRYWSWGFKESVVAPPGYRMANTAVRNGQVTAFPTANSIKAKSGTRLWRPDAEMGWCANGIRSEGLTDAICN